MPNRKTSRYGLPLFTKKESNNPHQAQTQWPDAENEANVKKRSRNMQKAVRRQTRKERRIT